jgi:hypothetical protein
MLTAARQTHAKLGHNRSIPERVTTSQCLALVSHIDLSQIIASLAAILFGRSLSNVVMRCNLKGLGVSAFRLRK